MNQSIPEEPKTELIPRLKIMYVGLIRSAAKRHDDTIYLVDTVQSTRASPPKGAITMDWGLTVLDLLRRLGEIYGERFASQILTTDDSLRNGVYVLVDGVNIDHLDGVLTRLEPSSESQLLLAPASSGG